MGAKPKIIYTDDEKTIASSEFKQYVDDEGIELYRTRGHPAFSERFIRTFKDKLFKRIEADENRGKQHIQWIDYIFRNYAYLQKIRTFIQQRVKPQTKQGRKRTNLNQ